MPLGVGGCLSLHWTIWRDRGAEPWVVEVLRMRYRLPFSLPPPLSPVPIPLPSYSPSSVKGIALHGEVSVLLAKGAIELTPPSPGFYSRLFVVWKTSGSLRPVIDLSRLNEFFLQNHFKMESSQLIFSPIRRSDWMVSIDLNPPDPDTLTWLGGLRLAAVSC